MTARAVALAFRSPRGLLSGWLLVALAVAPMFTAVRDGGKLHIIDYGRWLMHALFRLTVQHLDGVPDNQPNADGVLEALVAGVDPEADQPTRTVRSDAVSLFRVRAVSSSGLRSGYAP